MTTKPTRDPNDPIKSLVINSSTTPRGKDIAKFMPIVEMIARKELRSSSGQYLNYDELVNTGLITINKLIENARNGQNLEYNSSYIAQSVKWAMKDEMRSRQTWYGVRRTEIVQTTADSKTTEADIEDSDEMKIEDVQTMDDARRAVFEVIMSVETLEDEAGFSPSDTSDPRMLDYLEMVEMKQALVKAVSKLPDNLKRVVQMRFIDELSGNEVADKLGVTPSRISHMINEAVRKLRVLMAAEGYRDAV